MQIPNYNKTMRISQKAWLAMEKTIGWKPAETGGLGFGLIDEMIIREFVPDPQYGTGTTYTINSPFFNEVIQKFESRGFAPLCIAHSHPPSFRRPSQPDIRIGNKYLDRFELQALYFPIAISKGDKEQFTLLPYAFAADAENDRLVKLTGVEIIPDEWLPPLPAMQVSTQEEAHAENNVEYRPVIPPEAIPVAGEIDYSRVEQAVSIPVMQATRLVVTGVGGGASFCKQIARLGIGHITIIDPDNIGVENIPRQSYNLADAVAKRAKVEALKEAIHKINPAVTVEAIQADFTQLDKETLDSIIQPADILLFLTDSFACQSFGNKVALAYNKPAIWAGYYKLSRAAELFFYMPNVTPACFRCAVSPRYETQAKQPVKISSAANTVFHSSLLDSYLGFICLAVLHNNVPGFEFSGWFPDGFDRNFIQFKTHPSYDGMFKELYGNDAPVNFGAVWQQVQRETVFNGYSCDCMDCAAKIQEGATVTA